MLEMCLEIMNAEEGRKILKPKFLFFFYHRFIWLMDPFYMTVIFFLLYFFLFFLCEMNNLDLAEERHAVE
jgi:hypothetical protein